MTDNKNPMHFRDLILPVGQKIMEVYWIPLYRYLQENTHLIKTFSGFLLKHEKLVFYFGKTHLAVEYYGPERIDFLNVKEKVEISYHDYTQSDNNFLEQIIGFKFDSSSNVKFPLAQYSEGLFYLQTKDLIS